MQRPQSTQFIFRLGVYNQIEGRLKRSGGRYLATGPAKVIIVNPDQEAARRIEPVAGPKIAAVMPAPINPASVGQKR